MQGVRSMVREQYIMDGVYLQKTDLGDFKIFSTDGEGHEVNTIYISRKMVIYILKFMDRWLEE